MIDCKEITGLWNLKSAYMPKDAGKVFSCFSCAGGSTMGYKLAGFDVIGMNEIDPKVAKVYQANHNPKYSYICSIRDLVKKEDLPEDMYNLDILDGSPPCTSFSIAGNREKDWGKKKKFSEGQTLQRLDDLFFEFIALAKRLQPKIIVAENVYGMLTGKSKGYVKEIIKGYSQAGYNTQLFILNGANMGLPQARRRVFFISVRKDLNMKKLKLNFKEKPILFWQVEEWTKKLPHDFIPLTPKMFSFWHKAKPGDQFSTVHLKGSYFNHLKVHKNKPMPTMTAGAQIYHYKFPRKLSVNEFLACSSFPMDYDFLEWVDSKKGWAMGMSVPPFMMQRIALEIRRQWGTILNG